MECRAISGTLGESGANAPPRRLRGELGPVLATADRATPALFSEQDGQFRELNRHEYRSAVPEIRFAGKGVIRHFCVRPVNGVLDGYGPMLGKGGTDHVPRQATRSPQGTVLAPDDPPLA